MAIDADYSAAEVADRLAIHEVMARYVHAIDERDYDRLDSVFTSNCNFDFTSAGGIRDEWSVVKPWYGNNLHVFVDYFHLIGNISIEFDADGQTARTKSKVINPSGMRGDDGEIHHFEGVGTYHDVWTKTHDGWRISERAWVNGWIWGDYPFTHLPGDFNVSQQSEAS